MKSNRMLEIVSVAVGLGVFFAGTGCTTTPKPSGTIESVETVPFLGTKAVRFKYKNGLKLVVVEDRSSPTFSIQTWFDVGSRDEDVGYTGLAHLFEHLMFKGTKTHPDGTFDRTMERNGAEGLNAFTSRDYTAYIQELPKAHLDSILSFESDRMVNLVVNDKSFRTEREVVQNERRFRNENSPEGLMYQKIYELAYDRSSYRWPVIGYEKDLARMSAKDAEAFYRRHYAPNRATLVIVGDVDPQTAAKRVDHYYGSLVAQPTRAFKSQNEKPLSTPRREILRLNTQVEKIFIAYRVPSANAPGYPAFDLLATMLATGKSSRLQKALVDRGIATSVSAYSMNGVESSLMLVGVSLQNKRSAKEAEAVVLKEISALEKELAPDSEIQSAKNRLLFDFYDGLSNNADRARTIGYYETTAGKLEGVNQYLADIQKLNADDVQRAVRQFLKSNSRAVVVGVKK